MGVPRLSRWIMERFPSSVRTSTKHNMKGRIDNLYIDFNGLIHECLLRAAIVKMPTSEQELYFHISSYLNEVVTTASPTKKVYLAIDGPAPDAKIRQQRLRRIMGQLTSDSQQYLRQQQGWQEIYDQLNSLVEKYVYDDGCATSVSSAAITPGTSFMRRLHNYMVIYLAQVTELEQWGNIEIVFSGCQIPGEGEHKIINDIKNNKQNIPVSVNFQGSYEGLQKSIVTTKEKKEKSKISLSAEKGQEVQIQQEYTKIEYAEEEQQQIDYDFLHNQKIQIESNCIFGMDGDLFILLLGIHLPECYIMRRWQGVMVEDIVDPLKSKIDPWNVGMVYVDMQVIREGIICECLRKYIIDDNLFYQLVNTLEKNSLTEYFINQYKQILQQQGDGYTVNTVNQQLKAYLMEYFLFTEVANRIVNDFIAITLFVGNDFLPEIPGQNIKSGALDQLITYYQKTFISELPFKHFINEDLSLNLEYFNEMFGIIARDCEMKQIVEDIDSLKKMYTFFQSNDNKKKVDSNGQWYSVIANEYGELRQDLGNLVDNINYRFISKLDYASKQKITSFYKKHYYQKFNELQLKHKINPPIELRKKDIAKLAMLDQYENQKENNQNEQYKAQLQNFIENDVTVSHYLGFHNLVRSYFKTLQWVIFYYLERKGCPQWNWEYDFPFTPLCSDMATYCQLFNFDTIKQMQLNDNPQESGNTKQSNKFDSLNEENSDFDNNITSNEVQENRKIDVKSIQVLTEKELQEEVLKNFIGPKFCFTQSKPKSQLQQLMFTLEKSKAQQFLPDFVYSHIDQEFLQQQPGFKDVVVIDHESAFRSFNCRLDLTQKTASTIGDRYRDGVLSYGYQPNFSTFYKDYPIGLADGVHFEKINECSKQIVMNLTQEKEKYMQAHYSVGAELIFINKISQQNITRKEQLKKLYQICSTNTKVKYNEDDFDIDYCLKFRSPGYQQNKLHKTECHPVKQAFDKVFCSQIVDNVNSVILKNTNIFIDSIDTKIIDNVKQQILLEFQMQQTTELEVIDTKQINQVRYRGAHLFTERMSDLRIERRKFNIVTLEVNGNCLLQDLTSNNQTTQKIPTINQTVQFSEKFDQQLLKKNILQINKLQKESILPINLINQVASHFEIDKLDLLQSQIYSYYNDYAGVICGFVFENRVFLRRFENQQLQNYQEITDQCNKFYKEQSKEYQMNDINFIENIKKTIDEFGAKNQGVSYGDGQIILLMAPLKYHGNKLTISEITEESFLHSQSQSHCFAYRQFYRVDLCPYEGMILQPVCLQSFHRKYQRTLFLRSITGQLYLHDTNPDPVKVYYKKQNCEIYYNNNTYQFQKQPTKFTNLDISTLQQLYFANTEYELSNINRQLKQYDFKVEHYSLNILFQEFTLKLNDSSNRQLGLNLCKNKFFLTNKNKPNKFAELAFLIYVAAFPKILRKLYKVIENNRKHYIKQDELFGQNAFDNKKPFQYENVSNFTNIFNFPAIDYQITNQNTLYVVFSIMQMYANTVASPLVYQCLIEKDEDHISINLLQSIREQFTSQLKVKLVEKAEDHGYLLNNNDQLHLLDFVFLPKTGAFGYIISILKQNGKEFYKVQTDKQCISNYNSSYKKHNVAICSREEVYLIDKQYQIDLKELADQTHKVEKPKIPDFREINGLDIELTNMMTTCWLSNTKSDKPAKQNQQDQEDIIIEIGEAIEKDDEIDIQIDGVSVDKKKKYSFSSKK